MIAAADMKAVVTNELGVVLNPPLPTGASTNFGVVTNIAMNTWRGGSFRLPLPTTFFSFLTNSIYRNGTFEPLTGRFDRNQNPPFALPHWWFTLNTRLRFILLDTTANRIVDYVNLSSSD